MSVKWRFEHSVEVDASTEFAWQFWTVVENWAFDSDIESVSLNGPFAQGSSGTTVSRSVGAIQWKIAEVGPGRRAVVEIAVIGATARFRWVFAETGDGKAVITQIVTLEGDDADQYVSTFGAGLEQGLPAGMKRLAEVIEEAARGGKVSHAIE